MEQSLHEKQQRSTFPTGNLLRALAIRGFGQGFRQRGPVDGTTAAILRPLRVLHNRQVLHRAACPVAGQGLGPVPIRGVVVPPIVWYRAEEMCGMPAFTCRGKISTIPDISLSLR